MRAAKGIMRDIASSEGWTEATQLELMFQFVDAFAATSSDRSVLSSFETFVEGKTADYEQEDEFAHVQPRLMVTFRPQVWVNDYAVDIENGEVQFDATKAYLKNSLETLQNFRFGNYDTDHLAEDLPERQMHDGPFEVDADGEVQEFLEANGIEDYETMTQEQLNQLREKYGVKNEDAE